MHRMPAPAPRREAGAWDLHPGEELVPVRSVVQGLGGDSRHERYLVWDQRYFVLMVAKVLRPGPATDPEALRGLCSEALALETLRHPGLVRVFDVVLDGPRP